MSFQPFPMVVMTPGCICLSVCLSASLPACRSVLSAPTHQALLQFSSYPYLSLDIRDTRTSPHHSSLRDTRTSSHHSSLHLRDHEQRPRVVPACPLTGSKLLLPLDCPRLCAKTAASCLMPTLTDLMTTKVKDMIGIAYSIPYCINRPIALTIITSR